MGTIHKTQDLTRVFDMNRPFVVQKPFSSGGIDFKSNDPFPHKHFKVSTHRLQQLFNSRFLRHSADTEDDPVLETVIIGIFGDYRFSKKA